MPQLAFRHLPRLCALLLVALLGACSATTPPPKMLQHISTKNSPESFRYCYGQGCYNNANIHFTAAEWAEIRQGFAAVDDAAKERDALGRAIGRMEQIAARQAGTSGDRAGSEFFKVGGTQLDCYDEAINTSNFLGLLARDGLLQHHRVSQPIQRTWVGGDLIHATAVVTETGSGRDYVIDSSFFASGTAASVAPVAKWQEGWIPPGGNYQSAY